MPQVMIECPKTGDHVYAGLNFDWTTFDATPLPDMKTSCRSCGSEHEWTKEDAFLLSDGGEE